MKIIRFQEAARKLAEIQEWSRSRPDRRCSPAAWRGVKDRLIRGFADYQRRRLIRMSEIFEARRQRRA
jgi:hypothetical protein